VSLPWLQSVHRAHIQTIEGCKYCPVGRCVYGLKIFFFSDRGKLLLLYIYIELGQDSFKILRWENYEYVAAYDTNGADHLTGNSYGAGMGLSNKMGRCAHSGPFGRQRWRRNIFEAR
jgi:hypothetical protein